MGYDAGMRLLHSFVLAGIATASTLARADEGMWTFHDFPSETVKAKYGFAPDPAWLEKARLASARTAGGCSASFVSADGLVMTAHHCAHDCVAGLSSKEHDFVKDGFYAKTLDDEKRCPDMEIQRVDEITDVSAQVTKATAGKTGAAYTAALRDISAAIEKQCQTAPDRRCEVVNLYHGGQFMLYRYKRFTDVRVVFAPELASANFGGDPDNFEFPRYNLTCRSCASTTTASRRRRRITSVGRRPARRTASWCSFPAARRRRTVRSPRRSASICAT